MIFFGVAKISLDIFNASENKYVTTSQIENSINNADSTLISDITYNSEFGYKIFIPKGFKYSVIKEKKMLIITKTLNDDSRITIAVNKIETNEDLTTVIKGATKYLQSINDTYKISKYYEFKTHMNKGIQVRFEVVKEGIKYKGLLTLFKNNSNIYMITASTTRPNWENSRAEIELILSSFTLL